MLCSISDIEKQKPTISGQIRLNFINKHLSNSRIFRIIFLVLFVSILASKVNAQVSKEEDVLLTFRYPAVGHVYVSHLYNDNNGQSFLPVAELFGLLGIYYNPDFSNFILKGTYLTNDLAFEIRYLCLPKSTCTRSNSVSVIIGVCFPEYQFPLPWGHSKEP